MLQAGYFARSESSICRMTTRFSAWGQCDTGGSWSIKLSSMRLCGPLPPPADQPQQAEGPDQQGGGLGDDGWRDEIIPRIRDGC